MYWTVIGMSYGGSLAAWARMKYPEIIFCAIAINAPMLAKADFSGKLVPTGLTRIKKNTLLRW